MFHLNVTVITEEVISLTRNVNSFVTKLKSDLQTPNVQAIAAMFPGGTQIDQASIALCNDAIAASAALPTSIQNAGNAVNAIFTKLTVDLVQLHHNNPKHTLGYYIKCVGTVLEDIASQL